MLKGIDFIAEYCHSLDLNSDIKVWAHDSTMPYRNKQFPFVVVPNSDFAFTFGGCDTTASVLSNVLQYNNVARTWSFYVSMLAHNLTVFLCEKTCCCYFFTTK